MTAAAGLMHVILSHSSANRHVVALAAEQYQEAL